MCLNRQTRHLFDVHYLLSRTKCHRQLNLPDTSIPYTRVFVVDDSVRPARAWKLMFTTHAHNKKLTNDNEVKSAVDN